MQKDDQRQGNRTNIVYISVTMYNFFHVGCVHEIQQFDVKEKEEDNRTL